MHATVKMAMAIALDVAGFGGDPKGLRISTASIMFYVASVINLWWSTGYTLWSGWISSNVPEPSGVSPRKPLQTPPHTASRQ
jgi:hypothetical protein